MDPYVICAVIILLILWLASLASLSSKTLSFPSRATGDVGVLPIPFFVGLGLYFTMYSGVFLPLPDGVLLLVLNTELFSICLGLFLRPQQLHARMYSRCMIILERNMNSIALPKPWRGPKNAWGKEKERERERRIKHPLVLFSPVHIRYNSCLQHENTHRILHNHYHQACIVESLRGSSGKYREI